VYAEDIEFASIAQEGSSVSSVLNHVEFAAICPRVPFCPWLLTPDIHLCDQGVRNALLICRKGCKGPQLTSLQQLPVPPAPATVSSGISMYFRREPCGVSAVGILGSGSLTVGAIRGGSPARRVGLSTCRGQKVSTRVRQARDQGFCPLISYR